MEMGFVKFLFLFVFFLFALDGGKAADMSAECNDDLQKLMTCLNFAQGKVATPTKECCDSATSIKDKDPKCLCYIIQQMQSGSDTLKSMGVQTAKLLQLPSACQLKNASISNCPKLLGLSPGSPEAAIFTNISSLAPPTTASPVTGSSASDTSSASSRTQHGSYIVCPVVLVAVAILFHALPAGSATLF
ncbi:hypothetical protein SLE2022_048170 [Rubroshorea leprosula]